MKNINFRGGEKREKFKSINIKGKNKKCYFSKFPDRIEEFQDEEIKEEKQKNERINNLFKIDNKKEKNNENDFNINLISNPKYIMKKSNHQPKIVIECNDLNLKEDDYHYDNYNSKGNNIDIDRNDIIYSINKDNIIEKNENKNRDKNNLSIEKLNKSKKLNPLKYKSYDDIIKIFTENNNTNNNNINNRISENCNTNTKENTINLKNTMTYISNSDFSNINNKYEESENNDNNNNDNNIHENNDENNYKYHNNRYDKENRTKNVFKKQLKINSNNNNNINRLDYDSKKFTQDIQQIILESKQNRIMSGKQNKNVLNIAKCFSPQKSYIPTTKRVNGTKYANTLTNNYIIQKSANFEESFDIKIKQFVKQNLIYNEKNTDKINKKYINGLEESLKRIYLDNLQKIDKERKSIEHAREVRLRKLNLDIEEQNKKYMNWILKEEIQRIKNDFKKQCETDFSQTISKFNK